jgi:hypothetical protein
VKLVVEFGYIKKIVGKFVNVSGIIKKEKGIKKKRKKKSIYG